MTGSQGHEGNTDGGRSLGKLETEQCHFHLLLWAAGDHCELWAWTVCTGVERWGQEDQLGAIGVKYTRGSEVLTRGGSSENGCHPTPILHSPLPFTPSFSLCQDM